MKVLYLALALTLTGCRSFSGSELASADDYSGSRFFDTAGDYDAALEVFPSKEKGGFVTTVERGWLDLAAGHPRPEALLAVGKDLEARKTVHVSKEAKAFFYKETEEGYFPAEHEAIALHIIAGMSLAAKGDAEGAKVEARRASFYLEDTFAGGHPFDDPALRLWLATLWASTGDWESARVDLRKAFEMNHELTFARNLAARKAPPPGLALVLDGSGPEVKWAGTGHTVEFVFPGKPPEIAVTSGSSGKALASTPPLPTAPWYVRHQDRNKALQEVFKESRYMLEATTSTTAAAVTLATGFALGLTTAVVGITGGVAFIYVALPGATGDSAGGVVLGGLAIAGSGVMAGLDVHEVGKERSKEMVEEGVGQAGYYRYVRFLPDRVRLVALDSAAPPRVTVVGDSGTVRPFFKPKAAGNGPQVFAYLVEDGLHPGDPPKPTREVRHWPLTGTKHYAIDTKEATAKDAFAECFDAPVDPVTKEHWRLPGIDDLKNAVNHGILKPGRENLLAKDAQNVTRVWSDFGTFCHSAVLSDSAESKQTNCEQMLPVICVIGRD